ncbi:hypothetical protein ACERII_06570 [Evansella sp. AB-rgal1]
MKEYQPIVINRNVKRQTKVVSEVVVSKKEVKKVKVKSKGCCLRGLKREE